MFLWKQTWTTANRTENAVPDNFRLPTHFAEKQPTCFPIIEKNPPFSFDGAAVKTDFRSSGNVGARFKRNIYSGRCDSQTDSHTNIGNGLRRVLLCISALKVCETKAGCFFYCKSFRFGEITYGPLSLS
ncbi:hypothetical protein CDAR_485461 [Caerostris darwini]|uniref:Uncharacterized protein n=1 Tax=Caerostris darwini TaxID=1538125 RepID=A0AAV4PAT9_9ARAC|nr:hypothetical protein CDAR_485461 [Caerostris darwini]